MYKKSLNFLSRVCKIKRKEHLTEVEVDNLLKDEKKPLLSRINKGTEPLIDEKHFFNELGQPMNMHSIVKDTSHQNEI